MCLDGPLGLDHGVLLRSIAQDWGGGKGGVGWCHMCATPTATALCSEVLYTHELCHLHQLSPKHKKHMVTYVHRCNDRNKRLYVGGSLSAACVFRRAQPVGKRSRVMPHRAQTLKADVEVVGVVYGQYLLVSGIILSHKLQLLGEDKHRQSLLPPL